VLNGGKFDPVSVPATMFASVVPSENVTLRVIAFVVDGVPFTYKIPDAEVKPLMVIAVAVAAVSVTNTANDAVLLAHSMLTVALPAFLPINALVASVPSVIAHSVPDEHVVLPAIPTTVASLSVTLTWFVSENVVGEPNALVAVADRLSCW
jgi:hypothetical protein